MRGTVESTMCSSLIAQRDLECAMCKVTIARGERYYRGLVMERVEYERVSDILRDFYVSDHYRVPHTWNFCQPCVQRGGDAFPKQMLELMP